MLAQGGFEFRDVHLCLDREVGRNLVVAARLVFLEQSGDASVAAQALRARIATVHDVKPDRVIVGCGSGDVLRLAVEVYAGPRRKIVAAVPTSELIEDIAERAGAEIAAVPLDERYGHDLDAMLARADASVGLVYICNPNNPTGTLTRRQAIDDFLRRLPPPGGPDRYAAERWVGETIVPRVLNLLPCWPTFGLEAWAAGGWWEGGYGT